MLAWNSITPPSKSTYYRNLHRVENAICRMAEESCKHYWDAMDHNTIIAFDGSWSQRRNAFHCITDFIDTKNRKIVYFSIKEKNNHKLFGNFAGASNGMEVSGVKDFVKYAKYDKRISGFCHDRDAKSSNVFANSQWNIPEYIDKNHMTKSFDKIFKEVNSKYQRKLFCLRARLRNYLNVLYYLDESVDEKKKHWMNSLNHYCGDHSECLHSREDNKSKIKSKKKKTREFVWDKKDDEVAIEALRELLESTTHLFDKTYFSVSTQLCECFHSLKAKYADKNFNWQSSWKARVCAAILDINEGYGWKFYLYQKLNLPPLDEDCRAILENHAKTLEYEKLRYEISEIHSQKNLERQKKRRSNKMNKDGFDDYIGEEYSKLKKKLPPPKKKNSTKKRTKISIPRIESESEDYSSTSDDFVVDDDEEEEQEKKVPGCVDDIHSDNSDYSDELSFVSDAMDSYLSSGESESEENESSEGTYYSDTSASHSDGDYYSYSD